MSIALENNRISGGGFLRRNQMPPSCNLGFADSEDRQVNVMSRVERERACCSSASSSSIGKNSDDFENGCGVGGDEDEEVQSKLKKTSPFDSAVSALEQSLPIRRGISKFYNGKSKSFASLNDAACSSIKKITKPENAHSRKRKNVLAYNILYANERNQSQRAKPMTSSATSPRRSFSVVDLQHCASVVNSSNLMGKRGKTHQVS